MQPNSHLSFGDQSLTHERNFDRFDEAERLVAVSEDGKWFTSDAFPGRVRTILSSRFRLYLRLSRRNFLFLVAGTAILLLLGVAAITNRDKALPLLVGSPNSQHKNGFGSGVTPGVTIPGSKSAITGSPPAADSPEKWEKPAGFKIIGLVFFGRRAYVNVLDCYLRRNLVSNGGYLDEVWFLENTANSEDLAYLSQLLTSEPLYTLKEFEADMGDWTHMWNYQFDNDIMYLKIDDDVVYVHDNAVPEIVHTLMAHPEAHSVQSNVVNSPNTNWHHFHGDAVYPYLPEIDPPPKANMTAWRPSELPRYPAELARDRYPWPEEYHDEWSQYKVGEEGGPPYKGHRWLPMAETSAALHKTPIEAADDGVWGRGWTRWAIAAQQHYSLFENIERDTMEKYHFGTAAGLFNTQYVRYKINFFAFWGRTLNKMKPGEDDEHDLTEKIPRALGMPVLVQTRAIVAHFSFGPQRELWDTDLLRRYRAYANEFVCAANNQKVEITTEQPGLKEAEEKKAKEAKEQEAEEQEAEEQEAEKQEAEKQEAEEQEAKEQKANEA